MTTTLPETVLGIDPGPTESAYALIDTDTCRPRKFGKGPNAELRDYLRGHADLYDPPLVAIEMVASYGMVVGADVFQTVLQTGRFVEVAAEASQRFRVVLAYRHNIKLHHCHSAHAKDTNVIQALIDRFAPRQPNKGKGTKAAPGFFYGFRGDIWQAFALAAYVADSLKDGLVADSITKVAG
jgi:hypothetical protein